MILYISGPMTGIEQYNHPAFHAAAADLRAKGYEVISPAEIEQPILDWEACMRRDIRELMFAHKVVVLPGWQKSKGAKIEVNLALDLGMEVIDARTLQPVMNICKD
jgi:hypothetical protein